MDLPSNLDGELAGRLTAGQHPLDEERLFQHLEENPKDFGPFVLQMGLNWKWMTEHRPLVGRLLNKALDPEARDPKLLVELFTAAQSNAVLKGEVEAFLIGDEEKMVRFARLIAEMPDLEACSTPILRKLVEGGDPEQIRLVRQALATIPRFIPLDGNFYYANEKTLLNTLDHLIKLGKDDLLKFYLDGGALDKLEPQELDTLYCLLYGRLARGEIYQIEKVDFEKDLALQCIQRGAKGPSRSAPREAYGEGAQKAAREAAKILYQLENAMEKKSRTYGIGTDDILILMEYDPGFSEWIAEHPHRLDRVVAEYGTRARQLQGNTKALLDYLQKDGKFEQYATQLLEQAVRSRDSAYLQELLPYLQPPLRIEEGRVHDVWRGIAARGWEEIAPIVDQILSLCNPQPALLEAVQANHYPLIAYLSGKGIDLNEPIDGQHLLERFPEPPERTERLRLLGATLADRAPSPDSRLWSPRLLGNLLGDGFFSGMRADNGEKLEGAQSEDALELMRVLLDQQEGGAELERLSAQLKECEQIARQQAALQIPALTQEGVKERMQLLSLQLQGRIKRLEEGESLLLPGGWKSQSGAHALLVEIVGMGEGTYQVRLFNTGDGTQFGSQLVTPTRSKIPPCRVYNGVPESVLMEGGFVPSLLEACVAHHPSMQLDLEAPDVVVGIFGRFQPYESQEGVPVELFMTGQRAGSCTIRSIKAWMRYKLGAGPYKQLIRQVNVSALRKGFEVNRSRLGESPALWRVLHHAGRNVARMLQKREEIRPQELELLRELRVALDGAAPVAESTHPQVDLTALRPTHTQRLGEVVTRLAQEVTHREVTPEAHEESVLLPRPTYSANPLEYLRAIETYCRGSFDLSTEAPAHIVGEALLALPPPGDAHWDGISPDDATQLLVQLQKSVAMMRHVLERSGLPYPHLVIAAQQGLLIGHRLACKLDPRLQEYGLSRGLLQQLKENRYAPCFDRALEERLDALIAYCGEEKPLFDYLAMQSNPALFQQGSADLEFIRQLFPDPAERPSSGRYQSLKEEVRQGLDIDRYQLALSWEALDRDQAPAYYDLRTLSFLAFYVRLPAKGLPRQFEGGASQAHPKIRWPTKRRGRGYDYGYGGGSSEHVSLTVPGIGRLTKGENERGPSSPYQGAYKWKFNRDPIAELDPERLKQNALVGSHDAQIKLCAAEEALIVPHLVQLLERQGQRLYGDHPSVVETLLFQHGRLRRELEGDPTIAQRVIDQLERNLAAKELELEIEGKAMVHRKEAFQMVMEYARTLIHLHNYLPSGKEALLQLRERILKWKQKGQPELVSPGLLDQLLVLTFAHYPAESREERHQLLAALFSHRFHPARDELGRGLHGVVGRIADQHHALLRADIEEVLPQVLHEVCGLALPEGGEWSGEYPTVIYTVGADRYEILVATGIVKRNGLLLNPEKALHQYADVRQVFGSRPLRNVSVAPLEGDRQMAISRDAHGREIRITFPTYQSYDETDEVVIQKEYEGEFFTFLPWKKVSGQAPWPALPKRPVEEHYLFWQGEKEARIIDRTTAHIAARIGLDGRLITGEESLDVTEGPLTLFGQFAPGHTIAATEKGGKIEIHCTAHKLRGAPLSFEQKERGLIWKQNRQFVVDQTQAINGIRGFQRFIVLTNRQGKRKALITVEAKWHNPHPYTECMAIDLDSSGRLAPKSTEQRLLVSYLYLMHGEYRSAMETLQKGHQLTRYSAEELRLLGWIALADRETGDYHPDAMAVRAYAFWLGSDNLFRNPSTQTGTEADLPLYQYNSPEHWEGYWRGEVTFDKMHLSVLHMDCYQRYLASRRNVSVGLRVDASLKGRRSALLAPYQEMQMIDRLIGPENRGVLGLRRLQLAAREPLPLMQPEISVAPVEIPKREYKPLLQQSFRGMNTEQALLQLKRLFPRTRPKVDELLNSLGALFHLAEKQRPEVIAFLGDMRFHPDPRAQAIRLILEAVATRAPGSDALLRGFNQSSLSGSYSFEEHYLVDGLMAYEAYLRGQQTPRGEPLPSGVRELPSLPTVLPTPESELPLTFEGLPTPDYTSMVTPQRSTPKRGEAPEAPVEGRFAQARSKALMEDYAQGCQQNDAIARYTMAPQVDLQALAESFQQVSTEETEARIEALLNQPLATPEEEHRRQLAYLGGERSRPDIPSCIAAFLHQQPSAYLALNEGLSPSEVEELNNLVGKYLYTKIYSRRQKRLKELALRLHESPTDKEVAHQLGELLMSTHAYVPQDNPVLLVFEYAMELNIRPDQVQDIYKMLGIGRATLAQTKELRDRFLQKMMGGGKTLILGTILSMLKADGFHLSVLVPPSSLYETNAQDMKLRAERVFGQKCHTIRYTRHPEQFTLSYLEGLHRLLLNAILNQDVLILPPDSLQALENQYLDAREKIRVLQSREPLPEIELEKLQDCAQQLKKILALLKERGIYTIDEVDLVLATRQEHNFPIGERISLHPTANELMADLFCLAAQIPELGLRTNTQALLTREERTPLMRQLAAMFVEHLYSSNEWQRRLYLQPQHRQELLAYLQGEETAPPAFVHELYEKHPQEADWMILLHKQLTDWLPTSWEKSAQQHYAFSVAQPDKRIAIPCVSNNTPREGSEFADEWEMINRTLHLHLCRGLDQKQTKLLVQQLREQAELEWKRAGRPTETGSLPTVRQFMEETELHLLKINTSDSATIDKVQAKLRAGGVHALRWILDFTVNEVLNKEKTYTEQVSSNGQSLASQPKIVEGYSGTLKVPPPSPIR